MRPPPRIYPSSEYTPTPLKHLYATLPESTHPRIDTALFYNYMRHSHNLPLPPTIYPVLYKVTLPESTSSFQNIPPFSTTICDVPRIYPALQESTPPSQNIGLPRPLRYVTLPEYTHPSRIYHLLRHYMRTPIIYPSLPEYTHPLNMYMRHSQYSHSNPKYTPF